MPRHWPVSKRVRKEKKLHFSKQCHRQKPLQVTSTCYSCLLLACFEVKMFSILCKILFYTNCMCVCAHACVWCMCVYMHMLVSPPMGRGQRINCGSPFSHHGGPRDQTGILRLSAFTRLNHLARSQLSFETCDLLELAHWFYWFWGQGSWSLCLEDHITQVVLTSRSSYLSSQVLDS